MQIQHQYQIEHKLLSLQDAANLLGLPYFKVQRAAKAGIIPTYSLLNKRKYVKLGEIVACMAQQT